MNCNTCGRHAPVVHARCGRCGSPLTRPDRIAPSLAALASDPAGFVPAASFGADLLAFEVSPRDARPVRSLQDLPRGMRRRRNAPPVRTVRPAVVWVFAVAVALLAAGAIVLLAVAAHRPG